MSRTWNTWMGAAALAALLGAVAGCGSGRPTTVPVSGTVTLDGTPLEGATVTFYPASGGRPATGTTDAQGQFTLTSFESGDGALPGAYNVTVIKMAETEATPDPESGAGEEALMGAAAIDTKSLLPVKYANVKTSGLSVEVQSGMEPVTLALSSS